MKPQDVIVLLKMAISEDGDSQTYASMAQSLKISAAEIHAATQRAAAAGLLAIVNPRERKVNREKFLRWLEEAAATSFPAKLGPIGLGLPTGLTAVHLPEIQTHASDLPFVWPSLEGAVRGKTIKPLYKSAPFAARQDRALHECLALVDLLRIGTAREEVVAVQELERRIKRLENAPLIKSNGNPFDISERDIVNSLSGLNDAPSLLANLMRRIILSLEPVSYIHFGADKAVFHSGFDGVLETSGCSRFATNKKSYWEIGCWEDTATKLQKDFDKRNQGVPHPDDTLVLLTAKLLTHDKRHELEVQFNQTKRWNEVRIYDATDLAQWLALAIPAAVWFREQMGTDTIGLETADDILARWRCAARVQPEVTALGREPEKEKFLAWLQNPSASALHIRAETIEECVLFAVSVISSSEAHKEQWASRIIIARKEEAWQRLLSRLTQNPARPLLLIPMFPEFDGALLKTTGHFVLVPSEPGTSDEHTDLYLRPYPREELEQFLLQTKAGGAQAQARQLAVDSGGKLTSLVRLLSGNFPRSPAWLEASSTPGGASIVGGLLLAGAWDPRNENDKRILRTLCDSTDEAIEREVNFLLGQTSDPPLREQGYSQKWRSHADAWRLLSPHLTETQLGRFQNLCIEVLSFASQKYGLPVEKRMYAGVLGINDPHSAALRKGLADSLAWLRVNKGRLLSSHVRDKVAPLIRTCLSGILTGDWKRWATLGEILTPLAEAAPETFLSCLKAALRNSKDSFAPLFQQQARDSVFTEFTPSGLLWALETIAWYDIDFLELVKLLVELSKLDTAPHRSTHTPFSVLSEYFHPQLKRCAVSNDIRIKTLEWLCANHANLAWKLLAVLVKHLAHGGFVMQNRRPRFAALDSLPQDFEEFPPQEAGRFFNAAIEQIKMLLDQNPDRACDILDSYVALVLALDCLSHHSDHFRSKPPDELRGIQEQLRVRLRFPPLGDKNGELHRRIQEVITALDPDDPSLAQAWLFSRRAKFKSGDVTANQGDKDAAWIRQRNDIIASIPANHRNIESLLAIARAAPEPALVGETVAQSAFADDIEQAIWFGPLLRTGHDAVFAEGFVLTRFNAKGWPWLYDCLTELLVKGDKKIALRLVQSVPSSADMRDWIEQKLPEAEIEYWKLRDFILPRDLRDTADFRRCIQKFVSADSWCAALDLVGLATFDGGTTTEDRCVDIESVLQLLEFILNNLATDAEAGAKLAAQSWHLDSIFRWLNNHMAAEHENRLLRLELNFFGLLQDHDARQLIFKKLAHDPAFYIELLVCTYRAASSQPTETPASAREQNLATLAWRIHQEWKGYPGDDASSPTERDALLVRWCEEVIKLAREKDREQIAKEKVGEVLVRVPAHEDGIWPCRVAREYLRKDDEDIRTGLYIGKRNSRGIVSRSISDGGSLERELAAKYQADADRLRLEWPETAKLLDDMAREYEEDAKHQDKQSERFE
jgi:hypothetical protein